MPILGTLVTPGPDRTFLTTVYRKPTHTGQYLQWDSRHHLHAKCSVFNTHTQSKDCMFKPIVMAKGEQHIKGSFISVNFPVGHSTDSKLKLTRSTTLTTMTITNKQTNR